MSREIYRRSVGPHLARIGYDGGIAPNDIQNLINLQRYYEQQKDFIKLLYCPALTGNKIRVSGANSYISKGYDIASSNDLSQSTAVNQPYVGCNIALNENLTLKAGVASTGSKTLTLANSLSFTSADNWSLIMVIRPNYSDGAIFINSSSYINWFSGAVYIFQSSGALIRTNTPLKKGKFNVIEFGFLNGTAKIFINGVSCNVTSFTNGGITFDRLNFGQSTGGFDGDIAFAGIFSKRFTDIDSVETNSVLSTVFKDVPCVPIISKHFSTSNVEATCSNNNSTTIPEANNATTWQTGAAGWAYLGSDISKGIIYGKVYNKAARNIIVANPPEGYHVATEAELTALAALGADALRLIGSDYWTTATGKNITGFSAIGGAYRNTDGSWNAEKSCVTFWCADSDKVLKLTDNSDIAQIVAATANEGHYIRLVKN